MIPEIPFILPRFRTGDEVLVVCNKTRVGRCVGYDEMGRLVAEFEVETGRGTVTNERVTFSPVGNVRINDEPYYLPEGKP